MNKYDEEVLNCAKILQQYCKEFESCDDKCIFYVDSDTFPYCRLKNSPANYQLNNIEE